MRVHVDHFDSGIAEPLNAAVEIDGLTHDYFFEVELAGESRAVPAWSECGYEDLVAVGFLPAGFPESICFAVDGWIIFLDPAVVATTDEVTFKIEYSAADGNSPF